MGNQKKKVTIKSWYFFYFRSDTEQDPDPFFHVTDPNTASISKSKVRSQIIEQSHAL